MDNIEKKDWFGLYYTNQDKTYIDFLHNGVKPEDIEFKSRDDYKKNEKIVQAFTTPDGKFNESAFNDYYNKALSSYNSFSAGEFEENSLPEIQYDIMSPFKPQTAKTQDLSLDIIKESNPFIRNRGLNNILGVEGTNMSVRELAQQNKIFNTDTQSWMDKTPEDLGFWGTVTETPIVLAQYDEDTEEFDKETGRRITRLKGEYKLDQNGRPYYETLGNREVRNKQVLSAFDVITRENSSWNKLDFFDNDGEESSIGSTTAQLIATTVPFFIPYVGQAYAATLALREGTKLGITLYKMVDGFINNNRPESDFGLLNTIEAKAYQFNTSVSDKSQQSMLTYENFGRLVSDVSSQLFQQRLIAQIPKWLGVGNTEKAALKAIKSEYGDDVLKLVADGSIIKNESLYSDLISRSPSIQRAVNKAAVRNNWLGRFMANFYMSGVSTMDVYNDALNAGYDRRTAAITAGLAMGATTWMIQTTEIGQKALQGLGFDEERRVIRAGLKEFVEENRDALRYLAHNPNDKAAFNSLLRKIVNKAQKIKEPIDNIIAGSGVFSNAVAEGIEEMSEEAIMDMSKAITDAYTGLTGSQREASFKFLESNPLERYLMAGFGGAVGGAIFKMANNMSELNRNIPDQTKENILYLIRNGKTDKLLDQLEKYRKIGVAPKNLSATSYEVDGDVINYKEAQGVGDSQNDAVIDLSAQMIRLWDSVINEESLNVNDDEVIEISTLRDKRLRDLLAFDGRLDIIKDFNTVSKEIGELAIQKKDIENQLNTGGRDVTNKDELTRRLEAINIELDSKREIKNNILSGANIEEYLKKALFSLSDVGKNIYSTDIYTYTEHVTGRPYSSLSDIEKETIKDRYKAYREEGEDKFNTAYRIFNSVSENYKDKLLNIVTSLPNLSKIQEYLSYTDESAITSLDEEAKRNFDLARKLGVVFNVPVERGIDYLFEFRDKDLLSDPELFTNVKDYFYNLNIGGRDLNVDISKLIESSQNSTQLLSTIFDSLNKLTSESPEFTNFLNNVTQRLGESSVDPSTVISLNLYQYLDSISDNDGTLALLRDLTKNINATNVEELVRGLENILSEFSTKLQYEFIPQLRSASMKQLIEAAKKDNLQLTKDLYKHILSHLKPDNEYEFNDSQFAFDIAPYLDEDIIESLDFDLSKILDLSSQDKIILGDNLYSNTGMSLADLTRLHRRLKSADSWTRIYELFRNLQIPEDGIKFLIPLLNKANKAGTKSSFTEYKNTVDNLVPESSLVDNPIVDLLNSIYLNVSDSTNTETIFSLLSNESNLLKSTNTLSDFILQGKVTSEQIDTATNVIDILQSVLASMQNVTTDSGGYGFNSTINYVRDKLGITDKLVEIDSNSAYKAISELERYKQKLTFYKRLSEQNKGNKLKEHKLTAIKVRQALIKNFQDSFFRSKAPELFTGIDDILAKYKLEDLTNYELSDDNYIELERLIQEVEDRLYDNAENISKTSYVSREQIISKLFDGTDYSKLMPSSYNNPSALNSEMEQMSPTDLFIYYHTILALKASAFNKTLKDVVNDSLSNGNQKLLIPIFSQEYVTRIATAMILDVEFMNNITELNKNFEVSITDEETRAKYKDLISTFKNLIFINGAPGVGKTNGVDKLVYRIANKLLNTNGLIAVGPGKQQAVNLLNSLLDSSYTENQDLREINSSIQSQNSLVLTKDDLISSILASPEIATKANEQYKNKYKGKDSIIEYLTTPGSTQEQIIRIKREYLTPDNFKTGVFQNQRLIFIDEVTQLSKFELELLSRWAEINNKILITSGDLLQSGFSDKAGIYLGIDVDTNLVYTPTLTTSLRISNIHKKDNLDALRVLTERVRDIDNYLTDGKYDNDKGVRNALKNYDNLPSLKYYEDNTVLNGEKIVGSISSSDIDKLISNSEEPVGYIYDNVNSDTYKVIQDYLATHPGAIKLFKLDEVQGSEAKYFIVDKTFDYGSNNSKIEEATRDLYTALTRSKDGTLIINNGLTTYLQKGSQQIDYTQNSILDNEAARSFSELRLKSLNSILENSEAETIPEPERSSTVAPPTRTSNITLDTIMQNAFSNNPEDARKIETIEKEESRVSPHPLDSFMCYTYRTRIKPKTMNNNGVETYSIKDVAILLRLDDNCEHKGFFNGHTENLNKYDFDRVDSFILEIKSLLYNYDKTKREEIIKSNNIDQNLNSVFRDVSGNSGTLDLLNGVFKLKATKYLTKANEESSIIRIIYEIPIINSSTPENTIELYIAELPNINNDSFRIKDTDSKKQRDSKAWFIEYEKFYGQVMNSFSLDGKGKANKYLNLRNDYELNRITNSVIYKGQDNKDKVHVPFEEKENEFKGIYFSKPYIVTNYRTGKESRKDLLFSRNTQLNNLYDDYNTILEQYKNADAAGKSRLESLLKSKKARLDAEINKHTLRGKAVVFATHSKYIYDTDGSLVTEDRYGDYYVRQISGEFDNDPERRDKIRMIVLNPEGLTFQQFILKYREFINSYKADSGVSKYSNKFYKSYFGDFTGFDILLSIYNYYNYLKINGKPESKHIKIAEKLFNSISALARKEGDIENPFNLPESKAKFGLPHILRIMERLHDETTPEGIKQIENYAATINGNDVLKFLNKIIELKIEQRQHPEYSMTYPIRNTENGGLFMDWNTSDNITDYDIIDFMEFAMLGKRTYEQADGRTRVIEVPNYVPLFKDGIYPFPVYELTDKSKSFVSGDYFYEARNPEGQYYIDRDLQPPVFAFRPSTDLYDSNAYDIPSRVEPRTERSTKASKLIPGEQKSSEELLSNFRSLINTYFAQNEDIKDLVDSTSINIDSLYNYNESISIKENLGQFKSKLAQELTLLAESQSIRISEGHELAVAKLENGKIKLYTRPIPTENNLENVSNLDNNKLYLQEVFGDMFSSVTNPDDLNNLENYYKMLAIYDSNGLLHNYILSSYISPDTIQLIQSNPEVGTIISNINKIRSKYNIC